MKIFIFSIIASSSLLFSCSPSNTKVDMQTETRDSIKKIEIIPNENSAHVRINAKMISAKRSVASLIGDSYYRKLKQYLPVETDWHKADCMSAFVPTSNKYDTDIRTNYLIGIMEDCEVLYTQNNMAGHSTIINYKKTLSYNAAYSKQTITELTKKFVADIKANLENTKLSSVEVGKLTTEFYSELQKEVNQSNFLQIDAKLLTINLTKDILLDTLKFFNENIDGIGLTFSDHTAFQKFYKEREPIVLGISGLYVNTYKYNNTLTVTSKLNQILKLAAEASLSPTALTTFNESLPSLQANVNFAWSRTVNEFKDEQFKIELETPSFFPLAIKYVTKI